MTALRMGREGFQPLEVGLYTACLGLIALLYALPIWLPTQIGTGYILISFGMSIISIVLWRKSILTPKRQLILSLILCLLLLPLGPLTSNDSERYLWDGAVFLSGVDPYLLSPNHEALTELRQLWPTPEEHAEYATLYPPGALTLFSFCALAGPAFAIWVWKGLLALCAAASLCVFYKLLKAHDHLKAYSLFAFSPLFLFEAQAGAHLDLICVFGIIAGLYAIKKDALILAGIIIGLAATVKFLPAVIIGPFLFYLKPKRAAVLCLSAALTWVSVYGLMFGLGYKPLGLLPTFFEKWRGGAPLYPILESVSGALKLSQTGFFILLGGLAVMGFALSAWLAAKKHIYIAITLSLAVPLLLSPVLFPWYLLMLVPLMALRPNMTVLAAVTLAPLSYEVLNKWLSESVWEPQIWPSIILLGGIMAGLVLDLFRNRVIESSLH